MDAEAHRQISFSMEESPSTSEYDYGRRESSRTLRYRAAMDHLKPPTHSLRGRSYLQPTPHQNNDAFKPLRRQQQQHSRVQWSEKPKCHLQFRVYCTDTRFRKVWDLFQLFVAFACCGMIYMYTHVPNVYSYVWPTVVEMFVSIAIVLGIIVTAIQSPRWRDFFWRWYIWVDLVSIVPIFFFLAGLDEQVQAFLVLRGLRVMNFYRVINLTTAGSITREAVTLVYTVVVIMILAAVAFSITSDQTPPLKIDSGTQNITIPDSLYFTVVTMTTVGFGDIVPNPGLPRVLCCGLIIAVALCVPMRVRALVAQLQSRRYFGSFRCNSTIPHVIIIWKSDFLALQAFLDDFLHPQRRYFDCDICILGPKFPNKEVRLMIETRSNIRRIKYLIGNPLDVRDLRRTRVQKAVAVFYLINKLLPEASKEAADAEASLVVMSIRLQSPHAPIYVQVLLERNQELLYVAGATHVVCVDQLRLRLVAGACYCFGLQVLASNLVVCQKQCKRSAAKWLAEYMHGAAYSVYDLPCPKGWVNFSFSQVCSLYYREDPSVFLIGVRSMKSGRVTLNPRDSSISLGDTLIMMAKSREEALNLLYTSQHTMITARNAEDQLVEALLREADQEDNVQPSGPTRHRFSTSDVCSNLRTESLQSVNSHTDFRGFTFGLQAPPSIGRQSSRLSEGSRTSVDSFVHLEEDFGRAQNSSLHATAGSSLSQMVEWPQNAKTSLSVVESETMLRHFDVRRSDVLVIGNLTNAVDFVRTLRHTMLSDYRRLIFLMDNPPSGDELASLRAYDDVDIVHSETCKFQGPVNLGSCGIVVILPSYKPKETLWGFWQSCGRSIDTAELSMSQDFETLVQGIRVGLVNHNIAIIMCLVHPQNAKFLASRLVNSNGHFASRSGDFAGDVPYPYAMGQVYLEEIPDKLLCNLFFSSCLTDVVEALVINSCDPESDFSQTSGDSSPKRAAAAPAPNTSHLFLISLPEALSLKAHLGTLTFRTLFLYLLCKDGYLAIGLLRQGMVSFHQKSRWPQPEEGICYVYTGPKPTTIVDPADCIYVLSEWQPTEYPSPGLAKNPGGSFLNNLGSGLEESGISLSEILRENARRRWEESIEWSNQRRSTGSYL